MCHIYHKGKYRLVEPSFQLNMQIFVCHDLNIGHSCLKKLKFQTKGHNHAGRSGDETETGSDDEF